MRINPTLGSVVLIPVAIEDAEFIVEIRADAVSKGFLKRGAENAEMQRDWLKKYFERSNQEHDHYFMITEHGRKCGTLRVSLLDPAQEMFTWGSWCLVPGLNPLVAIASYLLAYEVGFAIPEKKWAIFEVHQNNAGVLAFHRRMGAVETGVTHGDQIEFRMTREAFSQSRSRWIGKFQ
jgi:hypothetical protein